MRYIIALILALLLSADIEAATLTFNDNSTNESAWVVYIVKADGSTPVFVTFPSTSTPTIGSVSISLSQVVAGDCIVVAAFNNGGVSSWSNRACATAPTASIPTTPSGAVTK